MDTEEAVKIIYANWPSENYTMLREALGYITDVNTRRGQLIEDTANNFLALEPGICFQGGIDGAMKASVDEIRRLRSLLQAESAVAAQVESLLEKNAHLASALIDERANYLDTLKRNPDCSAWTLDECSPEEQNKPRQDAANTLSLEEPLVYVELEEARKQIGILKGKLIEERAKLMRIYDEPSSLLTLNDDYLSMAYLQLKEQIREVNWDGND